MEIYTMKIRFLTPVFIGSGYELDALSYTVQREDGKNYLIFFDIQKWLNKNSTNPEIQDALRRFNYLELRKIIAKSDVKDFLLYKIEIASSHFNQLYKEISEGKKEENQLIVELFPRNGTNFNPYLPGSSIKGSIRTAIGNYKYPSVESEVKKKCSQKQRKKDECYSVYNRLIFGNPKEDVFKYLKISDCILPKDSTLIVEPKEVSKKQKKSHPPKNFVEATKSLIFGNGLEVKTKCVIGDFRDLEKGVKRQIPSFNLVFLIERINEFYLKRYEEELKFYDTPHLIHIKGRMENIQRQIEKEIGNGNTALLRIGHFSHIECITWDNRKPKAKTYGTTRTLVNGNYPFGWVLISFEEGYKPKETESLEEKKIEKPASEEKISKEEEKELSEVDKICLKLINECNEQYSMEIYHNKLDTFSPEDQRKIAYALKECWQKIGKWGKNVSKKQKEKIKKIKEILGE